MNKNLSGSGSGTNPKRRDNERLPGSIGRNQRTNSTGVYQVGGRKGRAAGPIGMGSSNNLAAQRS